MQLEDLPEEESPPRHPTLETWLTGLEHSSDEFDTDVEDDIDTSETWEGEGVQEEGGNGGGGGGGGGGS